MSVNIPEIEKAIYIMAKDINDFNNCLVKKYNLPDSPYYHSGKLFPKIGLLIINEININYRFHGMGCTFWKDENEYYFNVDSTSPNWLLLSYHGIYNFLNSYLKWDDKNFTELDLIIEELNKNSILFETIQNSRNLKVYEDWYSKYRL
jgi:hypothetical protein